MRIRLQSSRASKRYLSMVLCSWSWEGAPPKFFLKKDLKLFQILILFDNDIEESVKTTKVLKCNFSQSVLSTITKLSGGKMPLDSLEGSKFFCRCVPRNFFKDRLPSKQKILDRTLLSYENSNSSAIFFTWF